MNNLGARYDLPSPISVTSIFSVYDVNLYNFLTLKKVSNSFTELIYIRSGSPYSIEVDKKKYTLNPGQILFFPPNSYHLRSIPTNAIVSLISFDVVFREMESLYNRVLTLDGMQKQQLEQISALGHRLLERIPAKGYTVGSSLRPLANKYELQKLKNLLELFLIDLYLKEANPINAAIYRFPDDQKLDSLIMYLKRNIDKPLTLKQISEKTFISVAKIRKLFYEKHTCAPMQYFNQLKIEAAVELMCNTALSYAEISSRLGFSSPSYFSRLFTKKMGMSPSVYIKSLKKQ